MTVLKSWLEGYLINQFFCERTNKRTDDWGGSLENRARFPIEIVKAVRKKVGPNFIIIYRLCVGPCRRWCDL